MIYLLIIVIYFCSHAETLPCIEHCRFLVKIW